MEKIIRNSVHCNSCGEDIESTHVHDFKWCSCKSIAVDGGKEYLKRVGNSECYTDTSITVEKPNVVPIRKVLAEPKKEDKRQAVLNIAVKTKEVLGKQMYECNFADGSKTLLSPVNLKAIIDWAKENNIMNAKG